MKDILGKALLLALVIVGVLTLTQYRFESDVFAYLLLPGLVLFLMISGLDGFFWMIFGSHGRTEPKVMVALAVGLLVNTIVYACIFTGALLIWRRSKAR
ncbi:MAG: hypothetical protein WA188_08310 [Terriglobales bacterium]